MKKAFNIVSDSTIQKESNVNEYVKNSKTYTFIGKDENGIQLCLDLRMAKKYHYSIGSISKLLNISCQEVRNQFNRMAKESGYKLFN